MECRQIQWKLCNEFNKIGNTIYLIKQDSDEVYTFTNSAVEIIDILSFLEQCTIEELILELAKYYELKELEKEEVVSFLKELEKENIIEILF
ncbi:MAG: hypothetical protein HFH15_14415 [Ruminococcus sp.]|nr:hypothetical protein [Ruminococcus sp.]